MLDELADELAAALSRAFRSYGPAGTKVTGRAANRQAAVIQAQPLQDAIRPGGPRWYAVDVPEGRRLLTSVSAIPSFDDEGQSALRTELLDTNLQRLEGDSEILLGRTAGANGRVRHAVAVDARFRRHGGIAPGRYTFQVQIRGRAADRRGPGRARGPAARARRDARTDPRGRGAQRPGGDPVRDA